MSCYLRATGPCTVTAYPSSTDESGAGAGSFCSGPLDAAGAPNIMNTFAFSGAHRISCYPMALRATSGFLSVIAWASVANSCYISAVINQFGARSKEQAGANGLKTGAETTSANQVPGPTRPHRTATCQRPLGDEPTAKEHPDLLFRA